MCPVGIPLALFKYFVDTSIRPDYFNRPVQEIDTLQNELRILTPVGMLGYGLALDGFERGLALKPHVITLDSGSTDSGPQKLGLGSMTCSREAYTRDLGVVLEAGAKHGIPVFISSAGGDGSDAHVDVFLEIAREIAAAKGLKFNAAAIYADIPKDLISKRLASGRVKPLGPVPDLTDSEIDAATVVVAQMGAEPFIEAMRGRDGLNLIISGRAYDPAPLAAFCIAHGFDPALSWHMGKIMECGAMCAEPNGRNIMGYMRADHFELEPLNPAERCTTQSVAAHTLYEKSHPYFLYGPGGMLDVSDCVFEQVSERRVRVTGSRYTPANPYTIKLEGAKRVGFRSIFIAGARDPVFIAQIDDLLERVRADSRQYFHDIDPDTYRIEFHIYGKNGVMGELEPHPEIVGKELCVIGEVAAPTQEMASAICGRLRTATLHAPYPGKQATAGNVAMPFTPLEIPLGEVCVFNIYHLMEVDSPTECFPIRYLEI